MKISLNGKTVFVGGVALAVTVAVIAGLIMAGSPEKERMRRADDQRLNDLQQISYAMDVYWNREHTLPASLDILAKDRDVYLQGITDPRSKMPYEYRTVGTLSYELCASFETNPALNPDRPPTPAPENFWTHGVGRTCYQVEIKPAQPVQMVPKPVM